MLRFSFKYILVMLFLALSSMAFVQGRRTTIYAFTGSPDGNFPNGGVVSSTDGTLYGTTYYGGTNGLGTVYKTSPAGGETIVHSFAGGTDGAYPAAALFLGRQGEL